VTNIGTA